MFTIDKWNKTMAGLLVVALLLAIFPLSAAAQSQNGNIDKEIEVTLDGEPVKLSDPARKLDERVYLPVSLVAKAFGAKVNWDKKTEEATIHTSYGDKIVLGNGVPVVYFNEGRYLLDTPPFLVDGKLYIPLRHAAELMHAEVEWNGEEQTVELTTVQTATVTADYGLNEISKEIGAKKAVLLSRNGLEDAKGVKEGMKLKVVVPSILSHPAKPFTEEDYMLLAKITQVESGYESYEGQLGVANVILNRVKDSRFPGSIHDVIYSGKQFPPAHNGMLDKSEPNASVLRAAKDALNGKNNVEDAVYFFNPKVSKGAFWSKLKVIVTIGHHSFAK
ncbi:cell wall hydrolase [Paenibacillus sp. CAU 1782]